MEEVELGGAQPPRDRNNGAAEYGSHHRNSAKSGAQFEDMDGSMALEPQQFDYGEFRVVDPITGKWSAFLAANRLREGT